MLPISMSLDSGVARVGLALVLLFASAPTTISSLRDTLEARLGIVSAIDSGGGVKSSLISSIGSLFVLDSLVSSLIGSMLSQC